MSKFDVKDKIDRGIYSLFNLASDALLWFNGGAKKTLKRNERYHGLHKSQRCFILGTGPSLSKLTPQEIIRLSREVTFGVNSLYKVQSLDIINPTYYVLLDNNYWGVSSYAFQEIAHKYEVNKPVFITDRRAKLFVPQDVECIYLHAKHYPVTHVRCDISRNLSITMNVVGFSILCAIYMGFKEIYLLGCDYNLFCSRVGTHCYDDEDEIDELPKYNLGFYLKYYHLTTEIHYLIAKLARNLDVKIINLSEGSLLDAYPHNKLRAVI